MGRAIVFVLFVNIKDKHHKRTKNLLRKSKSVLNMMEMFRNWKRN